MEKERKGDADMKAPERKRKNRGEVVGPLSELKIWSLVGLEFSRLYVYSERKGRMRSNSQIEISFSYALPLQLVTL